jgi:hypothetical protein
MLWAGVTSSKKLVSLCSLLLLVFIMRPLTFKNRLLGKTKLHCSTVVEQNLFNFFVVIGNSLIASSGQTKYNVS